MDRKLATGIQAPIIPRIDQIPESSFSLDGLDQFITSMGTEFDHWKALPSPIGLTDRGDLRRTNGVDTISENGFIYTYAGTFTGVLQDTSRHQNHADAGFVDSSTSRIIMPRFYNKDGGEANGDRIFFTPGDRVYISDKNVEQSVSNYQRMEYQVVTDDQPMFPATEIEAILDSQNLTYVNGVDYVLTSAGNIRWLPNGKNPGIDPLTQRGRLYSLRYRYKAYFYCVDLPKELRLIQITDPKTGLRGTERAPYHLLVQREFIFHNKNNNKLTSDNQNTQQLQQPTPNRIIKDPSQPLSEPSSIVVDMTEYYDPSQG